jgi:hypothetical protein
VTVDRTTILQECGASDEDLDALLAYTQTPYAALTEGVSFPLDDEPHIDAWQQYAASARVDGAWQTLRRTFVQLQFPVQSGISEDEEYRRATRRGQFDAADAFAPGLVLEQPAGLEFTIHDSIAGRIPVIVPATRQDFVTLVQAFTERNEPAPVPSSMGACMVVGLNNWRRVGTYRDEWKRSMGDDGTDEAWAVEFKTFATRKPLYQDRFIILSRGPYSAIPSSFVGIGEDAWLRQSLSIRREHECVHYLTYRLAGMIRSNILDELLADFAGLIAGTGRYDPRVALRCLGIAPDGTLSPDSRLLIYRGTLSDSALRVVATLAARAAEHLERCAHAWGDRLKDVNTLATVIVTLASRPVEELAAGVVPLPQA